MKRIFKSLSLISLSILLSSISMLVSADDTDIFDEAPANTPNILFVMDVSGSMGRTTPSGQTRIQTLSSALTKVLEDIKDVNIGMMSFSDRDSERAWVVHGPSFPVVDIESDAQAVLNTNTLFDHYTASDKKNSYLPPTFAGQTARGFLQTVTQQWDPGKGTPIVGALFEAAKYMRGEDIFWGNKPPKERQAAHPSTYEGLFSDGSTTSKYIERTEPCGGTTGVTCNVRSQCNTTVTPPTISKVQIAGQDCPEVLPAVSLTCAAGDAFCGSATDAAQCVTTSVPTPALTGQLCILATTTDCENSDPLITACVQATPVLTQVFLAPADPVPSNCTVNGAVLADGTTPYQCSTPSPILCDKIQPDVIKVDCPDVKYSCTLSTTACTHIVGTTIQSSGVTYKSPIKNECSSNSIVLLSDGRATVNDSADMVANMIGSAYSKNCNSGSSSESCGEELATFLANTDNSPRKADGTDAVPGDQAINLFTVGFALGGNTQAAGYLGDLATAGGGKYFSAANEKELVKSLTEATDETKKLGRVFSSPTYTVTTSTSLVHGDDVYLPVFKSNKKARWVGNLKKFKQKDGVLVDKNNNPIFDKDGVLLNTAEDLWLTTGGAAKDSVESGGAANKIKPGSRSVWTDDGSDLVRFNSTNVTDTLLGVASSDVSKLIDFAIGLNADGSARHSMGDIIHSKPVYVPYPGRAKGGIIFIGTNEGYIHAINESDGTEAFAYMPQALLGNIKTLYENSNMDAHPYGVDGEITVWDVRKDKLTDSSLLTGGTQPSKNSVMIYFGLRRGGPAYYALDITNPDAPILKWIKNSSNYSELGFTWSKPTLKHLRHGSGKKLQPVLIFGGGYIDDNGKVGAAETDNGATNRGSSVYIVDAWDGDIVLESTASTINYAVPGEIKTLDINRDGSIDRLYFGDTGGNVWRLDIQVSGTGSVSADLNKFASLGGSSRKFFASPDLALFRHKGELITTIVIGSGDRADPLSKDASVDDYIYVLVDHKVMAALTTSDLIEPNDLGSRKLPKVAGWKMELTILDDEKVLSTPLIFQNNVMFSSFGKGKVSTAVNQCDVSGINQSRTYVMDLMTGNASIDLDGDKKAIKADPDDISVEGVKGIIASTPQVVFTKMESQNGGSCVAGDCIRAFNIVDGTGQALATDKTLGAGTLLDKSLPRVYWLETK